MKLAPSLHDQFDLDPYPGPYERNFAEEWSDAWTNMNQVLGPVAHYYVDMFGTISELVTRATKEMVNAYTHGIEAFDILADTIEKVDPVQVKSRDRHVPRTGSHGPYEGRGYGRNGKKRY